MYFILRSPHWRNGFLLRKSESYIFKGEGRNDAVLLAINIKPVIALVSKEKMIVYYHDNMFLKVWYYTSSRLHR